MFKDVFESGTRMHTDTRKSMEMKITEMKITEMKTMKKESTKRKEKLNLSALQWRRPVMTCVVV